MGHWRSASPKGIREVRKCSMALVRPYRPNLAELAIYRPVLESLDITFYYTGLDPHACRTELDGLGLEQMGAVRYRTYADWVRSPLLRRALNFKVGLGSGMLSRLKDVLRHDIINIVDPIYAHTWQIVRRMQPYQKLMMVRWENLYGRYEQVWQARRQHGCVLARADAIICVTQAALHTLRLPPAFRGVVEQIYPGIELADIPPPKVKTAATILFAGRPQWCKGFGSLLVAFHILRDRWKVDAELEAIGVEAGDFRALVQQLGLAGHVHFLSRLANQDVRAHMRQAALFCAPSLLSPTWTEQFGFAMVEAMAHGLPVVAFDSGAIREICGESGLYASAGNPAALADALRMLLLNPAEAERRGSALLRRCQREFNGRLQGAKMLALIDGLLSSRSSATPQPVGYPSRHPVVP